MAKNEFLPFGTAEGANVLSNQEYEALASRHNGFNSGVAKSKELNKVWRQASLIASAVAQFIVDTDQKDLLDTGDVADIKSRLASAINLIISNGDYVTNPYLKLELLKKIDKADITQQLGNDTSKVASQNLLTTELGKKASVADANSKLAKDQNGADIPDKPKFIENLGLPELLAKKINFDDIVRELSDDWYKVPSVSLLNQELGKKVSSTTFNQEMNKKADKNSLGTASSKNTGNGAGQIPDMSHFPFSGKGTDSIVVTLPNGLIIQAFKRVLLHSDSVGEGWNNTVNFPVAFPDRVVALLCTKVNYPQITVSCENSNLSGFNALTIKMINLSTSIRETTANFLVVGY